MLPLTGSLTNLPLPPEDAPVRVARRPTFSALGAPSETIGITNGPAGLEALPFPPLPLGVAVAAPSTMSLAISCPAARALTSAFSIGWSAPSTILRPEASIARREGELEREASSIASARTIPALAASSLRRLAKPETSSLRLISAAWVSLLSCLYTV